MFTKLEKQELSRFISSELQKYSDDQPRDETGKWTDGARMKDLANRWVHEPEKYVHRIKAQTAKLIHSREEIDPSKGDGHLMLYALMNSPGTSRKLYRGMSLKPNDPLMRLKVGDIFEEPKIASFTDDKGGAMEATYGGNAQQFLLVLDHGTKASVPITDLAGSSRVESDFIPEVLTNGKFKVTAIKNFKDPDSGDNVREVHAEHLSIYTRGKKK